MTWAALWLGGVVLVWLVALVRLVLRDTRPHWYRRIRSNTLVPRRRGGWALVYWVPAAFPGTRTLVSLQGEYLSPNDLLSPTEAIGARFGEAGINLADVDAPPDVR